MIPLLLDEGLPRRAAALLRDEGWDVVHVWDLGMQGAADTDLLEWAEREGRVVVTLDSDFPRTPGVLISPSLSPNRQSRVAHRRWRTERSAPVTAR